MRFPKASSKLFASAIALLGLSIAPIVHAQPSSPCAEHGASVEAEFRGCDSAGWCRFWIEPLDPLAQALHRVRPDGVSHMPGDKAMAVAVRDRLNALLSNMIHQAKHIELHDLRKLDDGTFAATVTVNSENLASDPIVRELRERTSRTAR
jgi:hypothetical protein